jgi:Amt family ammonium transporter
MASSGTGPATDMVTMEKLMELKAELEAKIEENTHAHATFNSGDTAWIMASSAIVLMMSLPGLALFYGGMTQQKNVLSTVMQTFSIAGLVTILWMILGYSLCFSTGSEVYGGIQRAWLIGPDESNKLGPETAHALADNIPESVFMNFQLTFAIITAAIVCGGFAERMKFSSVLVFIFFWHFLVYCPICHSEWAVDGFLAAAGDMDFAGGNVVHISSGVAALAASIIVGPRLSGNTTHPHNLIYVVMGTAFLWVGWFGFNGGSALGANGTAGMAIMVTQICAAASLITWVALEWFTTGKPSLLGACSGAVSGLVLVTPGSGYVDQTGAFWIGVLGTPLIFLGLKLKVRLGYDDALDAFGVHGVGGIIGGILVGFFANPFIGGEDRAGCFYGNCYQVGIQIYAIVVVAGWSLFMSSLILLAIKYTMGLRVPEDHEVQGLDLSEHGETMFGMSEAPVKANRDIEASPAEPIVVPLGEARMSGQIGYSYPVPGTYHASGFGPQGFVAPMGAPMHPMQMPIQ